MAAKKKVKASAGPIPAKITAEYVRGNLCRVIHVDGANGGITPTGGIHVALYSQHNKLPDSAKYSVDQVAKKVTEEPQALLPIWVREVEAELLLTREVGVALRDWLTRILDALDNPEIIFQGAEPQP